MGVKDDYRGSNFAGEIIRVFDNKSKTWKVTFFRMSFYFTGVQEGRRQDSTIVLNTQKMSQGINLITESPSMIF